VMAHMRARGRSVDGAMMRPFRAFLCPGVPVGILCRGATRVVEHCARCIDLPIVVIAVWLPLWENYFTAICGHNGKDSLWFVRGSIRRITS
jgi:hypothetical protein